MGCGACSKNEYEKVSDKSKLQQKIDLISKDFNDLDIQDEDNNKNEFKLLNKYALKVGKYYKNQKPPSTDQPFIDDIFPENDSSVFGLKSDGTPKDPFKERVEGTSSFQINKDDIIWLPPSEIFGTDYSVFEGKIEFGDISQGAIGDCYFMASIASMAEFPILILELFRNLKVTKNGCYEVALRIDGVWQVVLVNHYFPCFKSTKIPIFARPSGNEIWVLLLEKAWAKINGGYKSIVGGTAGEVLNVYTPFENEYLTFRLKDKTPYFNKILEGEKENYVMTCVSTANPKNEEFGIIEGHCFTIISAKEGNFAGKNIKLVKIRNPWGFREWKGNWSDSSDLWTDEIRKYFDFPAENRSDDGIFFMEFSDFFIFFSSLEICKRRTPVYSKHIKINENLSELHIFELILPQDSRISIDTIAKNYRFHRKIPPNSILPKRIIVAKSGENNSIEFLKSEFSNSNLTFEDELEKGIYTIFVQFDYECSNYDKHRKYVVYVNSNYPYDFSHVGYDKEYSKLNSVFKSYYIFNNDNQDESVIDNFKSSGIGMLFLRNLTNEPIKYSISLKEIENYKILETPDSEKDKKKVILKPNQAYVLLCKIGNVEKSYSLSSLIYKKSSKSFLDQIDGLLDIVDGLAEDLIRKLQKEKTVKGNYSWVHIRQEFDFSKICENINQWEVSKSKFQAIYPDYMTKILEFEKKEGHVIFMDKLSMGDSFYFGEWRLDFKLSKRIKHGRGLYCYPNGDLLVGYVLQGNFNGPVKLYHKNGDIVQINCTDNLISGQGLYINAQNGIKSKCLYENGLFKKWID